MKDCSLRVGGDEKSANRKIYGDFFFFLQMHQLIWIMNHSNIPCYIGSSIGHRKKHC